jgi:hypothetical protein
MIGPIDMWDRTVKISNTNVVHIWYACKTLFLLLGGRNCLRESLYNLQSAITFAKTLHFSNASVTGNLMTEPEDRLFMFTDQLHCDVYSCPYIFATSIIICDFMSQGLCPSV